MGLGCITIKGLCTQHHYIIYYNQGAVYPAPRHVWRACAEAGVLAAPLLEVQQGHDPARFRARPGFHVQVIHVRKEGVEALQVGDAPVLRVGGRHALEVVGGVPKLLGFEHRGKVELHLARVALEPHHLQQQQQHTGGNTARGFKNGSRFCSLSLVLLLLF